MNLIRYLSILLILVLVLSACSVGGQAQNTPTDATVIKTPVGDETSPAAAGTSEAGSSAPTPTANSQPVQEEPATSTAEVPAPAGKPPQSRAAEIRPPESRDQLTRLSTLLGFQVVDLNGANLGTVSDYIVNTCETYIIYFVLDPADDLDYSQEERLIIPFEAITINSGALDAQSKAIQLHLIPNQLEVAPAFPGSLKLIPTDWEKDVRNYWSQLVRLSNLTSECRVAGSEEGTVAVFKIAYATDLLGAEIRDGLQNILGTVEEAILAPESGKLGFFIVSLQDGQGLVLVPLRVVNIPKEALEPDQQIALVLLAENDLLSNAPRVDSIENGASVEAQNTARQYWNR